MRARGLALVSLIALLAALQGCGTTKKMFVGNIPPETELSVQSVSPDSLRAVNHLVRLHWFGSDPDGDVVAYEVRFFNDSAPADTSWVRLNCATGDCTDSLFTIHSPTGFTHARFEVRAVDNKGAVDPTPAVQTFGFLNTAPVCHILAGPGVTDSTYASVTITWNVDDVGGDLSKLSFRVYLDGNAAGYDSVYSGGPTATFTVPSFRFVQSGQWRTGYRWVFVQALDDGGRVGPPDSLRWFVRAPNGGTMPATSRGRALLVDNSLSTAQNDARVDTLYSNTLFRNLPVGTFSVLHLDRDNAFRSAQDLAQTFRQFEAVIWYRGYDVSATSAAVLAAYQDSIGAYVEHGGRLYLEGDNLFAGPQPSTYPAPPVRSDFVTKYLNARLVKYYDIAFGDSTVAWGNRTAGDNPPSVFRSSTLQDSLRLTGFQTIASIRLLLPSDTTQVAFWALRGALQPPNPVDGAVAMTARQPSGGRVVVVTFSLRDAQPTYASSSRLLAKLLFHATNGLFAP
jgi:hypothetical protein